MTTKKQIFKFLAKIVVMFCKFVMLNHLFYAINRNCIQSKHLVCILIEICTVHVQHKIVWILLIWENWENFYWLTKSTVFWPCSYNIFLLRFCTRFPESTNQNMVYIGRFSCKSMKIVLEKFYDPQVQRCYFILFFYIYKQVFMIWQFFHFII